MKQIKKKRFHSRLNIIEIEKKLDGWYYRGRKILETEDE